jgi:hypothetical protein
MLITSTYNESPECGITTSNWSMEVGGNAYSSALNGEWMQNTAHTRIAQALADCQNRCLTKASDVRANLVVTLMEFNQTTKMIATRARDVAKIFYYLKRGKLAQAKQYAFAADNARRLDRQILDLRQQAEDADPATKRLFAKQVQKLSQVKVAGYTAARAGTVRVPPGFWTSDPRFRGKTDMGWQNLILEFYYGWANLDYDAVGLANMAAQRFYDKPKTYSVSSTSRVLPSGFTTNGGATLFFKGRVVKGWYVSPGNYIGANFTTHELHAARCRAGLVVKVESLDPRNINQTVGNIPSNIYELTSCSFVLDWFLDIGTYLKNATALAGLGVITGYTAVTKENAYYCNLDLSSDPSVSHTVSGSLGIHAHLRAGALLDYEYTRSVWNGSQPPVQLGQGLTNLQRIASSVALIKQRLFSPAGSRRYTSR